MYVLSEDKSKGNMGEECKHFLGAVFGSRVVQGGQTNHATALISHSCRREENADLFAQ